MAKIVWNGGTLLAPVPPVLVSCSDGQRDNLITVAWTGIVNTKPPMTYISVRPERFSYSLIQQTGWFVINLATQEMTRAVDLCGVKSGRATDKWELCGLTRERLPDCPCPVVQESPVSLICRVQREDRLGSHTMFLASIEQVCVQERLIDRSGKLHLESCGLLAYCHGEYRGLGQRLGTFGFSVRKRKKKGSR